MILELGQSNFFSSPAKIFTALIGGAWQLILKIGVDLGLEDAVLLVAVPQST